MTMDQRLGAAIMIAAVFSLQYGAIPLLCFVLLAVGFAALVYGED